MSDLRIRAEKLLTELYTAGTQFLNDYPWEFEEDRWSELLVCTLMVELGIEATAVRASIQTLKTLGLTTVQELAAASSENRVFIERVLVQHGFESGAALKATEILTSLAQVVQRNWDGYLQRFLRVYGEKMAEELGKALQTTGINNDRASKIAVLWLQSVANLPVLLAQDRYIEAFRAEHGLSQKQLLDAADSLGLNVAVLDDLLALEALAASEAHPRQRSPKARVNVVTH